MDDIVAGDLAALGGVVVLAVRVCAFAGAASGQAGVASCLALEGQSVWHVLVSLLFRVPPPPISFPLPSSFPHLVFSLASTGLHHTHRSAAAAGRQRVGDAALRVGAVLAGRQRLMLGVCRSRDVHRSSCPRAEGKGSRAYDARPGCGEIDRPCPDVVAAPTKASRKAQTAVHATHQESVPRPTQTKFYRKLKPGAMAVGGLESSTVLRGPAPSTP